MYCRTMDSKIALISVLFITTVLFNNIIVYGEGYYLHLMPDSDGFYPIDKRAYKSYCQRCMMSENDWFRCIQCFAGEEKVKRTKASFINYGFNKNCNCCQKPVFSLLCCLNCSQKWK